MCLFKTHKKPKVSIFSKTVYKVLLEYPSGKFVTPYNNAPIELGKTYTGKFCGTRTLIDTIEDEFIEDGFIHSFRSLAEARKEKVSWDSPSYKIVKCRIPAFTYFYKGEDGEIASRKLKYIKVID